MNSHPALRKAVWITVAFLAGSAAAWAQVTITGADMFTEPGQYYRAYANATNNTSVNVSSMIGNVGGPQAWDFTTGPTDVVYRFDYLEATNTPYSSSFPQAQLVEQKTDESGAVPQSFLYFTEDLAKGRLDYGFYDPGFSAGLSLETPLNVFSTPLNDFPATIHYGDQWSSSTTYTNTIDFMGFSFPMEMKYSAQDKVDAYGIETSPGIGFGDCLRVNELVTYDTYFDTGSGYQRVETDWVRNYYWLRPGRGIVAQITSNQSNTAPPDNNFSTASAVLRMFQTNHPDSGSTQSGGIQGLKITLGKSGALIQWTALPSVTSYQVQSTTSLANPVNWQPVGAATTANYIIDSTAGGTNAPVRYYRVVGQN